MTGEDLCCVGVVPVQADLCLVAALGLSHVERNGHHYHPGLNYLPVEEQQAALAAHDDLYQRRAGRVSLRIDAGREGEVFEALVGVYAEPDVDLFRRLEDVGMTSGIHLPFWFAFDGPSTLDEKKRLMEGFAEKVLRHFDD